jgi:hypothetical protein
MDFIQFKFWKAAVFVLAAFVYGLYRGFIGQSLKPGPNDKLPPER